MPVPRLILASRSPRRAMLLREAGYEFTQAEPAFADPAHPDVDEHGCEPAQHAMALAVRKAESLRDILADHDAAPTMMSMGTCPPGAAAARASPGVTGAAGMARAATAPGAPQAAPCTIIISADTICVGAAGQLIGQPTDIDDARRIIRSFFGCAHDVVTGVALLRVRFGGAGPARTAADDLITFSDTVPVTFGRLSDRELETYLNSGQWKGKAGGYNLYNQQAAGWDVRIPPDADATTVVGLPMRKLAAALARWGAKAENAQVSDA